MGTIFTPKKLTGVTIKHEIKYLNIAETKLRVKFKDLDIIINTCCFCFYNVLTFDVRESGWTWTQF